MAKKKARNGVHTRRLASWNEFVEMFMDVRLKSTQFLYRGQRAPEKALLPLLDRLLSEAPASNAGKMRELLLSRFKYATRGRLSRERAWLDEDDNRWWALGRHHGLATPLLDWTDSPFVAAYFAFEEPLDHDNREEDAQSHRAVFALSRHTIKNLSKQSSVKHGPVKVVSPLSDDNPRLVSQRSLFTRAPDGIDVEKWVRSNCHDSKLRFLKYLIPENERGRALTALNRMNINRLTLFPDLGGAAAYCNLCLEIDDYEHPPEPDAAT